MAEPDEVPEWVAAALEEYKTQRAAILDSQSAADRTLALGVTAVGILVAGAFNVWDSSDEVPASALFLVVIPLVSALVLVQWTGQMLFLRVRREYLRDVEGAIRQAYVSLPKNLYTWEDTVNERLSRNVLWNPAYMYAATVVFQLIAAGSLVLGVSKGWERSRFIVLAIGSLMFVALVCVWVWLVRVHMTYQPSGVKVAATAAPPSS